MPGTHTSSTQPPQPPLPYIGRFAPSPSGPLHFGSLVCALASFLDARARCGTWLVRIEDIDPPREPKGAREAILQCLEAHGLHWDGELWLQSGRHEAYRALLAWLEKAELVYRCNCTRRRLQSLAGTYDGYCRNHPPPPGQAAALRLKVADLPATYGSVGSHIAFSDDIQGRQEEDLRQTCGDFVIHRKDGLFAYQLAVVADDIAQQITHVVRGSDLLDTTARQIFLFKLLGQTPPRYSHIPVLVDQQGQKLSKQNHATPVGNASAGDNLWRACRCLGLLPPAALRRAEPSELLAWAGAHWRLDRVPQQMTMPATACEPAIAKQPDA